MGVDFVVLCFTIAALARQEIHSGLWKLLFKDGLVYFCITFLCNAVPAVGVLSNEWVKQHSSEIS